MNRLKVGDIIYKTNWNTEYEVLEVLDGEDNYKLLNKTHGGIVVEWHYPRDLGGVIIRPTAFTVDMKTPVERKIAFMYQRFEKRNEL